jgi:hypothetical protein
MEPKINQSNENDIPRPKKKVIKSWSTLKSLVDGLDALANEIKLATGLHCDRSKLLNALSEAAIESAKNIDTSHIENNETLKEALISAMKKKHK